jgi:hypothetical protein
LEVTNLGGTNQNGSVNANPDSGAPSASASLPSIRPID